MKGYPYRRWLSTLRCDDRMDIIDQKIQQLEAEVAQLNRQLRATSSRDRKRKVELMKAIRKIDEELGNLRYQKKSPQEREDYWVWATNHQIRVQSEAGQDEYAIFNKA
jgi:seryl-tRNA synthetase